MPGLSWSLPAHQACPRANGSICDSCYASKGFYRFRRTRHAQAVRVRWTVEAMRTRVGRQQWIDTMIRAIRDARCRYFRVHDSGDMFSAIYAECWLEICRRMPEVRFLDSHACMAGARRPIAVFDPLLAILRKLATLPNVTVRPSALNFGDHAPIVAG